MAAATPRARTAAPAGLVDATALAKLASLSFLSRPQIERLAANAAAIRARRGATLFYEGEASRRIFILMSGVAKLTFQKNDERVLVGLVGPGEVFGVSSLLSEATRPFRCDAFSDCAVAVIPPEVFVDTVLGVPLETLGRTLDVTVGRWWSMLIRYANFQGVGLRERLASALLELGGKFGVRDARGILLTLKLTHADLAELVGASRQRITEHLIEFERRRLIIRDGRRLIIAPAKLAAAAEPPPHRDARPRRPARERGSHGR
jgi:CRP/FNR family transcriptional regulator, cyclic AMP receptor protein